MRLEWIEDLLAVLDSGSLTAAAEKRHTSQSAFTRRLRAIEEALSTELLDRQRKPVRLMPHVLEREDELRSMAARLHGLRNALKNPNAHREHRVAIACLHTVATTLSPQLIRDITQQGPVSVQVHATTRANCLTMLLTGEVDIGIVFETPDEALWSDTDSVLQESLGADRMVPVIAHSYQAEFERSMQARLLSVIAYPQDVYFGELFESRFLTQLDSDIVVRRVAETGLAMAVKQYALEGVGIAWLPESSVADDLAARRLLDVSGDLPSQTLQVKLLHLRAPLAAQLQRACALIVDAFKK